MAAFVGQLLDLRRRALLMSSSLATLMSGLITPGTASAVESATGFYLLGSKGSMAGVTPPPGVYLQDIKFHYSGSAQATLELGGILAAGVDADVSYDLPALLWVSSRKVLGGRIGLGAIMPVGWKDVRARAELDLPPPLGIEVRRDFEADDLASGDPLGTALIGWQSGNWHWNLQALVNVPVGYWRRRNLSNIGFNRWGIDTTAAATWLDAQLGWEVSAAAGFTFNFENPETDYRSGTEFHVEWAIVRSFGKSFGIGFTGFHYQQVTGDSGEGARLGEFKGRTTAIGPLINYNFTMGQVPVSTSLRYFKELDVNNRLKGDAGLLSINIPLWMPPVGATPSTPTTP